MKRRGYTLIEVMVALLVLSTFVAWFIPAMIRVGTSSAAEVDLQRALRVLHDQVELLRTTPEHGLKEGVYPFDPRVRELGLLVAGRGELEVSAVTGAPGLWRVRVKVHWRDPERGMRSIHDDVLKRR